jgi:hypothetical protein
MALSVDREGSTYYSDFNFQLDLGQWDLVLLFLPTETGLKKA